MPESPILVMNCDDVCTVRAFRVMLSAVFVVGMGSGPLGNREGLSWAKSGKGVPFVRLVRVTSAMLGAQHVTFLGVTLSRARAGGNGRRALRRRRFRTLSPVGSTCASR